MEKILTISIAAYNAESDISRCLDSLINSGVLEKLDVVVVNDGSKDQTSKIVKEYVEKYKDSIHMIDKENGGHGSTINSSIKVAEGKYYKILDSDDWVDSNNLAKLVCYLEANNVDLVLNPYHEVAYSDHSVKKMVEMERNQLEYEIKYDIKKLSEKCVLFMHSLTFKTDVIKKMGSIIDEHCFYVDMEYSIFPMLYVRNFVYLDYSVYQYLLGSQTQSMNIQNMIKRREQHLKVIKRLIEFYNNNESKLCITLRNIIRLRIKYAVYQQYKIYFSMSEKNALLEVKKFDSWLKKANLDLYSGVSGRFMKIINLNRKTNYAFFTLTVKILNKANI